MALSIGLAMDGSLGLAHGFAGYNAALLGILLLRFDRPPHQRMQPGERHLSQTAEASLGNRYRLTA
jgi:hypothetical protein